MMQFYVAFNAALLLILTTGELSASTIWKELERPEPHVVPKDFISWTIPYSGYDPVFWLPSCSDPSCDPESPRGLHFHEMDDGVDRRRARSCGKHLSYSTSGYDFDSSGDFPQNPAGRTGIAGRGLLKRWGPNHLVKVALISDKSTMVMLRKTDDGIKLPEKFVSSMSDSWYDEEVQRKIIHHLSRTTKSDVKPIEVIAKTHRKSLSFMSGSYPSDLNTDNAWVELHLQVILCESAPLYCDAVEDALYESGIKWRSVNKTSDAEILAVETSSSPEEIAKKYELQQYSVLCGMKTEGQKKLQKYKKFFKVAPWVGLIILGFIAICSWTCLSIAFALYLIGMLALMFILNLRGALK